MRPDLDLVLRIHPNHMNLSVRSRNAIMRMGLRNLGDVVQRSAAELLARPRFTEPIVAEIAASVERLGFRLGMGDQIVMTREGWMYLGPPVIGESIAPRVRHGGEGRPARDVAEDYGFEVARITREIRDLLRKVAEAVAGTDESL